MMLILMYGAELFFPLSVLKLITNLSELALVSECSGSKLRLERGLKLFKSFPGEIKSSFFY